MLAEIRDFEDYEQFLLSQLRQISIPKYKKEDYIIVHFITKKLAQLNEQKEDDFNLFLKIVIKKFIGNCQNKDLELNFLKQLIFKKNITEIDNDNSFLFAAIKRNNLKIVKLLLENGANVNISNNSRKTTPLYYAVNEKKLEVVKLLLENGAKPIPKIPTKYRFLKRNCTRIKKLGIITAITLCITAMIVFPIPIVILPTVMIGWIFWATGCVKWKTSQEEKDIKEIANEEYWNEKTFNKKLKELLKNEKKNSLITEKNQEFPSQLNDIKEERPQLNLNVAKINAEENNLPSSSSIIDGRLSVKI